MPTLDLRSFGSTTALVVAMDLPILILSSLPSVHWATTTFALVFISLSIHQQATKYTSGITTTLALMALLSIWALFRACTDNLLPLYRNGASSPLDFFSVARGQNFWYPGGFNLLSYEYALDRWWTFQMSLFMVGTWNVFLVTEGQHHRIKFLWAFMLLAEAVSVPLASNLFYLALVLSPEESQQHDVFVGPYLWGTTALSLCILPRLLYSAGPPTPQSLAFLHFLSLVPLLLHPLAYFALSVRRKWLYLFVHVVSVVIFVPILVSAVETTRPGDPHGSSVYSQWFTSVFAHFRCTSAAQDLLYTSMSFSVLVISRFTFESSTRTKVATASCLVLGIPFLNTMSALVLGVLLEKPRSESASILPSPTSHSSTILLHRMHTWQETGSQYHLLWTKDSQIYFISIPIGLYELDDLVGQPIPESDVYAPWRDSIQEACNPPSSSTFVKDCYIGPIMKILHGIDPFSQLYAEIAILEEICKAAHPNIVEYRGCLRKGDMILGICLRKYVCMLVELVRGEVAAELRPPYQPEAILSDIRAGLDFLHGRGLVHDDISPRNVMLDENGRAIIIDFDACRQIGAPSRGGTPGWATNPKIALTENDEYGLSLLEKFMRGEYDGKDFSYYDF